MAMRTTIPGTQKFRFIISSSFFFFFFFFFLGGGMREWGGGDAGVGEGLWEEGAGCSLFLTL